MIAASPARLTPPLRPTAVLSRPRLFARLDRRPVVVVAGMAGFGKSTLLSSWVAETKPMGHVAWLTLDDSDTDPFRLVADVLAAVRLAGPGPLATAFESLQAPPFPADPLALVDSLLEGLYACSDSLTLVLDDMQYLSGSPNSLRVVDHLLRWAPSGTTVALAARAVPALRLQRLRLDDRLELVGHDDLTFTLDETKEVLASAGLAVTPATAESVHQATAGWPAGVRMAGLAMAARGNSVGELELRQDDALADYLTTEVLASLDEDVRAFVLEATCDAAVCAPLVDVVRDTTDAATMLERCVAAGLFLTREHRNGELPWYRWHSLFATHMQRRVAFEAPERARLLAARAARWWHLVDPPTAIRHAVRSGDVDLAGEMFTAEWLNLLLEGRGETVLTVADSLPSTVPYDAEWHLARALVQALSGDVDNGRKELARARGAANLLPSQSREVFETRSLVIDLFLVGDREELATAVAEGRRLVRRIEEGELLLDPATQVLAEMCVGAGLCRLQGNGVQDAVDGLRLLRSAAQTARRADFAAIELAARAEACIPAIVEGRLDEIRAEALDVIETAQARGWGAMSALAPAVGYLGWLAYWRGDVQTARTELERALAMLLPSDWGMRGLALNFHAMSALACQDAIAAQADADEARLLAASGRMPDWWPSMLDALEARILLATGESDKAAALVRQAAREPDYRIAPCDRAVVLLGLGQPAQALATIEAVPRSSLPQLAAYAATIRAQALADVGQEADAHAAVEEALAQADASKIILPFIVLGRPMAALLHEHLRHGTAYPELVSQLLSRMARDAGRRATTWGERLTQREKTILQYLATNLTNAEIAEAEFISLHTAKTHIAHVYRKLGVSSRRAAIRRAAEMGLI